METLKKRWRDLPLRRFLVLMTGLSIGVVAAASALVISGCAAFRHWLLPEPDAVYLTIEKTFSDGGWEQGTYLLELGDDPSALPYGWAEDENGRIMQTVEQTLYSIRKIERSVDSLSPKRKLAYQICGIVMFAAPTVFAFAAILWCSIYFYRRKLKQPLELLADAAKQISEQNLDFAICYSCKDEMGDLCRSFDQMRAALYENYKAMWNMLEERRLMQASVAHDLRNPIAIVEGYTEYLENGLESGKMSKKKMIRIVQNLGAAAKRLEEYTESVRLINQSEEARLNRTSVSARKLSADITEDLSLLAKQKGIVLQAADLLPEEEIEADVALLYRVLENILNNALRYAKRKIRLAFSLEGRVLRIMVTDDGCGFPAEILNKQEKKLLASGRDGHMGIGISVSRLLCQKHGGGLELSNISSGACVKIFLSV